MLKEKTLDIFSEIKKILENKKNIDFKDIEEELTKIKWKPNIVNKHGDTLSHLLVRYNNWLAMESLIEKGESVILKNNHGHTAIWLSRKKSDKFFGKNFLAEYIKAKELGLLSDTLTHNPPVLEQKNTQQYLNSKNSSKKEDDNFDPLIEKITNYLKENNIKELNIILLNETFDINSLNKNGNTFLHEVVLLKNWDLAEEIINYGANVSLKNKENLSCLDIIEKDKQNLDKDIVDMFHFAKKDIDTTKIVSNENPPVKKIFSGNKKKVNRNISKVNFLMSDKPNKEIREKNYLQTELKSSDATIIIKKKKYSS